MNLIEVLYKTHNYVINGRGNVYGIVTGIVAINNFAIFYTALHNINRF